MRRESESTGPGVSFSIHIDDRGSCHIRTAHYQFAAQSQSRVFDIKIGTGSNPTYEISDNNSGWERPQNTTE